MSLICPQIYTENLIDQPYAKLIEARRELIAELEQLENSFGNNNPANDESMLGSNGDWFILSPSNDTCYKTFLEYLDELTNLMIQRAPELTGVPYATDGWDEEED